MTRSRNFLIALLLAGAGLLILAGESNAQMWRFRRAMVDRPVNPPGWPNRMPGWDWKYLYPYVARRSMYPPGWDEPYIYPWSPYNIGRNPYNPGLYAGSYPMNMPYGSYPMSPSPYQSYPAPGSGVSSPTYQAPAYGTEATTSQMLLPDPTGRMTVAPTTAAAIRLRVPDPFAEVKFDGVETESVGRTRYYVTPDLTTDKPYSYEVTARWKGGDGWVTQTRKIKVQRGKITAVDFTQKQSAAR